MTHSTSRRVKLQKKLSSSVKGGSDKFSDIGVIMRLIIDNKPVVNENGVLSGNANSLILQCQFIDFAMPIP